MKIQKYLPKACLLFAVVALAGSAIAQTAKTTPALKPISFPKNTRFKTAHTGEIVPLKIVGTNTSDKAIEITDVRPSCGCTLAKLDKTSIKPGEKVTLTGSLNTTGKLGEVHKSITIRIKGVKRPQRLFVRGTVLPQPKGHSMGEKGASIFSQACAACHVNPGKNRRGYQRYLSDCAMCHGILMEGNVAPALRPVNLKHLSSEQLNKKITEGSPNSVAMPGFGKSHDGPLSEKEIKGIVRVLKNGMAWNPATAKMDDKRLGKNIFQKLCTACHHYSRKGGIGPNVTMKTLSGIYTDEELEILLSKGHETQKLMPAFAKENGGVLNEKEIKALVQYLLHSR